jgi:CelD/BcsL family acetyltransferase involved in cellulose biosynthesis
MIDLILAEPSKQPDWNAVLDDTPCSSFFATSNWANLLRETYGYRPHYIVANSENGEALGVVPIMEIRSCFTGRRGVSLPFSDCCSSLLYGGRHAGEIVDFLIDYGKQRRWKYLELRAVTALSEERPVYEEFRGHVLDMKDGLATVHARLKRTIRQNIKKASNSGVTVDVCDSLESVMQYYRLHCITRKRHGVPPQPFRFFRNLHKYLISQRGGLVVLAKRDQRPIAGGVFLSCGKGVIYKYSASDERYQRFRPNELLTWKAIEHYSNMGCSRFCFGRTEHGQEGLSRYKRGWGTSEETIRYYRYDFRQKQFIQRARQSAVTTRLFKRLPIPLLRCLGSLAYKHVG